MHYHSKQTAHKRAALRALDQSMDQWSKAMPIAGRCSFASTTNHKQHGARHARHGILRTAQNTAHTCYNYYFNHLIKLQVYSTISGVAALSMALHEL
jgi:hypothetical protein